MSDDRGRVEELSLYGRLVASTVVTATGEINPLPENADAAGMNIPGTRFVNVFELFEDPERENPVGRDYGVCTGMEVNFANGEDEPPTSAVGLCHGTMDIAGRGSLGWMTTQVNDFVNPTPPGEAVLTGMLVGGTEEFREAGGQYHLYLEPTAPGEALAFRIDLEIVDLLPGGGR